MNKSALKKYAPQARKDFIAAVTRRAEVFGLNPKSPPTIERDGDVLLINGRPHPARIEPQRTALEKRIVDQGFAQVMEAMAYTWFNRFVAIRYMELHGFLDHGFRVLSHPDNPDTGHTQPEILSHIGELDLPGLDREQAVALKLAGDRDEELFREVLLAQCHALDQAMPFLFESLDDATELLLPDGLLRTDSLIGKLVTTIDEADWQNVEIIGWLYQFYISEKKDQVIGKVVKSEDIPAATQLFTPNWIVKYLVQNSLGRLWLMANPNSRVAEKWEYYIQPAEQTEEVNAQLDALVQARIAEDGTTLNPESLTLLDPACGSGHILVEAYDLLRDIYLERGYRRQDIPRRILEKNLYGLDIDDRAAQLAGFALLMKARADDRRLLGQPVALNVLALQDAKEGSAADLHRALNSPQIDAASVSQLVKTFEQAKTLGSLIQVSDELANALQDSRRELESVRDGGDMLGRDAAENLLRLVTQAEVLTKQFDAVVANPPYMGGKGMNARLKAWAKKTFPASKADLFAMFIERGFAWCRPTGFNSMVTMQSWMFLSSFEELRLNILSQKSISSMVQIGYNSFPAMNSKIAQATMFSIFASPVVGLRSSYVDLNRAPQSADKEKIFLSRKQSIEYTVASDEFKKLPGSPIAYWASSKIRRIFDESDSLRSVAAVGKGLDTGDNDHFLKLWFEVGEFDYWVPCQKGGPFRKWSGNQDYVINWRDDGAELRASLRSNLRNAQYYFQPGITWTRVSSSLPAFRFFEAGQIFESTGPCIFSNDSDRLYLIALLNSNLIPRFLELIAPTLDFQSGHISSLPVRIEKKHREELCKLATECIELARSDWNAFEHSRDFRFSPLLPEGSVRSGRLDKDFEKWRNDCMAQVAHLLANEERINSIFLAIYGLSGEVSPSVQTQNVTLTVNPAYRYGPGLSDEEYCREVRKDSGRELASYIVGCLMGRYSLDAPGLIYAHTGNEGFDPSRYQTFPADDDGIVPITDEAWFDDDAANRIREFVRVVWGKVTEDENMAWLAESLGSRANESPDDTIRRYLSKDFFKDHLKTYKKRPIYWLFSSGRHKAFEALVYLHRYNAGTLSRMRMEYVVPLQSKMQSRIEALEQDALTASSTAETRRLQKQRDKLIKQLEELRRFDENLRHYADQRIELDLDDGVKVNYGKFGDLLAEVKAVTGKKA